MRKLTLGFIIFTLVTSDQVMATDNIGTSEGYVNQEEGKVIHTIWIYGASAKVLFNDMKPVPNYGDDVRSDGVIECAYMKDTDSSKKEHSCVIQTVDGKRYPFFAD